MRTLSKTLFFLFLSLSIYSLLNPAVAQDFQKWETIIANLEKSDNSSAVKPHQSIVFTGSSSIVGWNSLAADFPNKKILNRAFGGSQTFEVLHFADRLSLPINPNRLSSIQETMISPPAKALKPYLPISKLYSIKSERKIGK